MPSNDTARERVADIIKDDLTWAYYDGPHPGDIAYDRHSQDATENIIAHLWQRADNPDVVEVYTKALTDEIEERHHPRWGYDVAAGVVEAALTAIIGPRKEAGEEADAKVARLQEVMRRWAMEAYTDDTFPGWSVLEYMNGLNDGDLKPEDDEER